MSGGTNTTNYNLYKPTEAEDVDITQINGNMDIVDTTLYNQSQAILENTSDIQALQDSLGSAVRYGVVAAIIQANQTHVSVTAPSIDGYTFVVWVGTASQGWVGYTYIALPENATADVYKSEAATSSTRTVRCYALYLKNAS